MSQFSPVVEGKGKGGKRDKKHTKHCLSGVNGKLEAKWENSTLTLSYTVHTHPNMMLEFKVLHNNIYTEGNNFHILSKKFPYILKQHNITNNLVHWGRSRAEDPSSDSNFLNYSVFPRFSN